MYPHHQIIFDEIEQANPGVFVNLVNKGFKELTRKEILESRLPFHAVINFESNFSQDRLKLFTKLSEAHDFAKELSEKYPSQTYFVVTPSHFTKAAIKANLQKMKKPKTKKKARRAK